MTRTASASDVWFRGRTVPGAALRLVCFPHAGGAATAYAGWRAGLPADVELLSVQYPGRQNRLAEPCAESVHELADAVTAGLAARGGLPTLLFGHSMGSAVAYEVARRLEQDLGTPALRLLVSGRAAPHRARAVPPDWQDDERLVASVRRLSEADAAVYDDPDLRPLLLPSLRADYRLLARYRPSAPASLLRTPVTAYGGDQDPVCPVAELSGWSEVTSARPEVQVFPGGHFYLREQEQALLRHLGTYVGRRPGPQPSRLRG